MSDPRLPPEISDYIVDLLHDKPETLKQCCLVSKSWVPRARRHLFGEVKFTHVNNLNAWKETFQDPVNSPAHYTRSLFFGSTKAAVAIAFEKDCWIRAFRNVVRLKLQYVLAAPLLSSLGIPALICSLPHLEDLTMTSFTVAEVAEDYKTTFQPSTSPPLTGTLTISRSRRINHLVTRLLGLPNGVRFRKLQFQWDIEGDVQWVAALVGACSDTLEHVDFSESRTPRTTCSALIDFSNATKLTSVVLRFKANSITWATLALETITSAHRHLREVTIHISFPLISPIFNIPVNARQIVGDRIYLQWMDLDRLLVRLSESGAVCVRVECWSSGQKGDRQYVEGLLPEMLRGGRVRLLDYGDILDVLDLR